MSSPVAPLRPVARPGAARELITSVDRDEAIEVTGAVGRDFRVRDLLRVAAVPAQLAGPIADLR